MIYTVTLNPSVDYVVHMNKFVSGVTNRTKDEEYYIGGKGINVSYILAQLGMESTALGFTAGFTGEEIEKGAGTQFDRELDNQMGRISFARNKVMLQETWKTITGIETVKAWCVTYEVPIMWVIPTEMQKMISIDSFFVKLTITGKKYYDSCGYGRTVAAELSFLSSFFDKAKSFGAIRHILYV